MNHAPVIVYADMSYRPIEWWSEQWAVSVSTIKGWIGAGTCPAKKVGGRWMISQLELLNWTPPETAASPDETKPGKTGTGKKGDGQVKGRGDLRDPEERRDDPPRAEDGRGTNRWTV